MKYLLSILISFLFATSVNAAFMDTLSPKNQIKLAIAFLNYEHKKLGGFTFSNIKSKGDILPKLKTQITNRAVNEDIVILRGIDFSRLNYINLRNDILGRLR